MKVARASQRAGVVRRISQLEWVLRAGLWSRSRELSDCPKGHR